MRECHETAIKEFSFMEIGVLYFYRANVSQWVVGRCVLMDGGPMCPRSMKAAGWAVMGGVVVPQFLQVLKQSQSFVEFVMQTNTDRKQSLFEYACSKRQRSYTPPYLLSPFSA